MDLGDEDLFAVFDNETSSKSQRSAVAASAVAERDDAKDGNESGRNDPAAVRFDAGTLSVEITGSAKRTGEPETEEPVKKMKKNDDDRTIMTGLSDLDIEKQIKADDSTQPKQHKGHCLVLAICISNFEGCFVYWIK